MSPIITTMSSPAGRSRRVSAPVSGGGGMPAAGPGTNAPSWSGKTTYAAEVFDSDIPISPSVGTDGQTALQGFDGYDGVTYPQTRVTYPTVSTPLGTKRVLRTTYPGSSINISALDEVSGEWTYYGSEYTNASVRITGTWSGTLEFQQSTDGGSSWNPVSLTGFYGGVTGSSTTGNGTWRANTANSTPVLLRVKATAWTSGTATVDIGFCGGQAPARWRCYSFASDPTRLYFRWVVRMAADWEDANFSTKGVFFSNVNGNNHVIMLTWDSVMDQRIVLQFSVAPNQDESATQNPTFGDWHDIEVEIVMSTPGVADGSIRIWVDGTLVNNQTAILTQKVPGPADANTVFFDPTYGGGVSPPPRNLYFDTAMVYAETAA